MADGSSLSFAKDIRPLFTDTDVAHMAFAMDLSDPKSVAEHADAIYGAVSNASMPPPGTGEPWTPEMCATFKRWMDEGAAP